MCCILFCQTNYHAKYYILSIKLILKDIIFEAKNTFENYVKCTKCEYNYALA